jgi:hypothetical protein
VRTMTPAASEPTMWYGRSCRASQPPALPMSLRNWKVGTGSNMAVQTVL